MLNLSLAASSTQSWQTDPLCVAVRSAVAAGLTVVVAAGNNGVDANGKEQLGLISAPGNDPSVITVGSANTKGTTPRADEVVNDFSSRGPTRGSTMVGGQRRYDNLLKPDLVAPGNKIVAAAATKSTGRTLTWNSLADEYFSTLVTPAGSAQILGETQMLLNGTSIATPVASGAVALMLQANPGLTPPLVKAILQYSAQPLPGYSLLAQGAGLLNIDGAVQLSRALRTDIAAKVEAGTLVAGNNLLAPGKKMPNPSSTINGVAFGWSRIAFAGGTHVLSGSKLFTAYQPIWNPRIVWATGLTRQRTPIYWSGPGFAANTFVKSFTDTAAPNQTLVSSGVLSADLLAGTTSSFLGKTGAFIPTATLSGWLAAGSGDILGSGLILAEGTVFDDGLILAEGLVVDAGQMAAEGVTLASGLILAEALKDNVVIFGEP